MQRAHLVGKQFGLLTVLSENGSSSTGGLLWLCRCACGGKRIEVSRRLLSGQTHSCGCAPKRIQTTYGEIPDSWLKQIEKGAVARKLDYAVSGEYLWGLFIRQKRQCALSGVPLCLRLIHDKQERTASLDRIDSTKGYVKGNVQWVHKEVNFMKQSMTQERFLAYVALICQHQAIKAENVVGYTSVDKLEAAFAAV